jgi:hypothetical protein
MKYIFSSNSRTGNVPTGTCMITREHLYRRLLATGPAYYTGCKIYCVAIRACTRMYVNKTLSAITNRWRGAVRCPAVPKLFATVEIGWNRLTNNTPARGGSAGAGIVRGNRSELYTAWWSATKPTKNRDADRQNYQDLRSMNVNERRFLFRLFFFYRWTVPALRF